MIRLNLVLLLAVLASAFYLVHTQYESRRLYTALDGKYDREDLGDVLIDIRKVAKSKKNRRVHVNTLATISGPVAKSALIQNAAGNPIQGTMNNCANGKTPWGTYLTCEENFNGYFGSTSTTWKPNVCVRMEKVSIVTTEMVYSPMLRSPLARVPRLGREERGIVAPPLQTSSLPKIKRERVVRVETLVIVTN